MKLVELSSDRGRGFAHAMIYLNPEDVSSVDVIPDDYNQTENRTVVRMKNGECHYVRGYSHEIAKKIEEVGRS